MYARKAVFLIALSLIQKSL